MGGMRNDAKFDESVDECDGDDDSFVTENGGLLSPLRNGSTVPSAGKRDKRLMFGRNLPIT